MKPYLAVAVAVTTVGLIMSGCGEDSEPAAAPQTVTVIERTVTAEAPVEETTEAPSTEEQSASPEESSGGTASEKIRVPNVVGKNHQLAQDTLQAAGLFALAEEDATGQGRALLFDRNWVVVSQSPKAGSKVAEDRTITLRSKKVGE